MTGQKYLQFYQLHIQSNQKENKSEQALQIIGHVLKSFSWSSCKL
jgi:hypothetical protein